MPKKSKSSSRWLQEHFSDPYVKKAWQDGYRARAAYKLIELQEKYHFLKPNQMIIDLGAAPGSWSQVAKKHIGKNGKIFALDLLPIDPIDNVNILQGDFTSEEILAQLKAQLPEDQKVDTVISDMAPNMSGHKTADQIGSMYLVELAFDFAKNHLKPVGAFVTKVFQGRDLDALILEAKQHFQKVHFCKPDASRDRSSEHFLVCLGYKGSTSA